MQMFSKHIIFYICGLKDYSLFVLTTHLQMTYWSPQLQTLFNSTYMNSLLANEYGELGVVVMPSTASHKDQAVGALQ